MMSAPRKKTFRERTHIQTKQEEMEEQFARMMTADELVGQGGTPEEHYELEKGLGLSAVAPGNLSNR